MENDTITAILDYAESHETFTLEALATYICQKTGTGKSSLSWYLFKLVNDNRLVRIGRGIYARNIKPVFMPELNKEAENVYKLLKTNFPFAGFCVYDGEIIAPLQHHLSPNRIIYVETERDSAETVFNFLKDETYNVYLRPDKELIYRYVDMDKRAVFVKNLVSEAPLQELSGVPAPTIEKLLVDILRDPDFFYLQGSESLAVMENAFNLYAVNKSRMLRYAGRRKVKEEVLSIMEQINL